MGILKMKEIVKMNENEVKEKLTELMKEVIKARVTIKKAGKVNLREMKKTIAKLNMMLGNIEKSKVNKLEGTKNKK